MPVPKLRASCTPDAMRSKEGNDSLDTFIRQAIGNDPFLSFSRTGDSQGQLFHLLHQAFEQPGWPLMSTLKVQMQKCDKCSREFCSTINYRRHIRVHRRSLNFDKESHKSRDLLGAFWDKLSSDEAKEIVSFKDVTLEEVPGSTIIGALTSFIHPRRLCTLPQVYVEAGSALLDIIQGRPRFPMSSQELFGILDDASEKTFLCAGTAESMKKYVFDGEAGKIGLEMKNLVACTSFLVEQKLVYIFFFVLLSKAWLADKDAEALRCQKLLVEEEEAAQKRQAQLLERKRQKKLRQKEQKVKEQANWEKPDLKDATADTLDSPPSVGTSSPPVGSESSSNDLETPVERAVSLLELVQSSMIEEDAETEAEFGISNEHNESATRLNVERRVVQGSSRRHVVTYRWQVPKSQRGGRNGFHASQNPQPLKLEPMQKHGAPRAPRSASAVNGNKVWTRKPKSENDRDCRKDRLLKEAVNQTDQSKNCEVMLIGSISVTLGNSGQLQGDGISEAQESHSAEHVTSKNGGQEKPTKTDPVHGALHRSTVIWRPVSRHKTTKGSISVQSSIGESREETVVGTGGDRPLSSESCLTSCALDDDDVCDSGSNSHPLAERSAQTEGILFASDSAKAFLTQRWKEAIAADHVKLVLSPEPETESPGRCDTGNDGQTVAPSSDPPRRSILGDADNARVVVEPSTVGTVNLRTKPEKGVKMKYIPKQRTVT
ncbi:uncharacterized protein LOC127807449 [Diospyros lotus]|uniref:uncharacterized protein LOC127807449 n=1 Tax=Diospyros lotus TaxID=55363 RepID=UPI0022543025|nr:uncharacterized protein LOC127807449 [Diospyros lotus]